MEEKPAEEAATETVPEATASDTGEKDIPPEDPVPDAAVEPAAEESSPDVAAAQQPSDPPQEEASSAMPTASEPPAEEGIAAEFTETAPQDSGPNIASEPQESEPDVAPEPVASTRPEEEAEAKGSEPAPSDTIGRVEPDHQDSGEVIEAANASEGKSTVSEVPAPVEIVEDEKQEDDNSDSPSRPAEEEQAGESQSLDVEAKDAEANVIDVAEEPDQSSDNSHPLDPTGGDTSQEGLPSHVISTLEQPCSPESDPPHPEVQSSDLVTSPEETDETVTAEAPTTADDIQDSTPANTDKIVQVIDVNNNDPTDDTAAIIVVDVNTPDTTQDTDIPPPPPPAPHVTISEPVKPSKSSKKRSSSSKSSKSRHGDKPKEKPVEIIPLKEGKVKSVAKGKSKRKVRGKCGRGSDVESGEVVPPPPPAPSPPPSGHVIEVVAVEEMQVIDETGGKDEVENVVVITTDSSSPDPEVKAEETSVVEQIDHVSDEKEESNHAADADTTLPPGEEGKIPEVVQAADTAVVTVPDQPEKDEPTPATADPSSNPDADATESIEAEQTPEVDETEQKDDDASAAMSSPSELDIVDPSQEEGDQAKEAEGLAEAEKDSPHTEEQKTSSEPRSDSPSENPAVDNSPQDETPGDSPPGDEGPNLPEATVPEAEKHDEAHSGDTTDDALVVKSSTAQQENAVESSTPATEEPKNPENVPDPVVEDNDASGNATNDAVETPEPSIEPATAEDSTSEALEDVSTSKASEPDPANTASTNSVPSEETEASSCPDSSAPDDGITPAASAEVVAEPAPTLMELAALILPSDPVPQRTEDVATNTEPEVARAEVDATILKPAIESEAFDPLSEVAVVEEISSKEEVVATNHLDQDSENADSVSPGAAIPSETATQDASLESDCKNEDGGLEASKEPTGEVPNEDKEPEVSTETAVPAKMIADDQEMDQPDSKADEDHGMEAEHVDEKTAPDQVDKAQTADEPVVDESTNSLDEDAQFVQTKETPEAGDSSLSDAAGVQDVDAQDTVAPAEAAMEYPETPPTTSEKQAHSSDESNNDAPIPEVPEAAENDTKDSSLPVIERPVAAETAEAEADIPQAEDTGASITEEKAPSNSADDSMVEGMAAPVIEPENGATQSPASIHEEATEPSEPGAISEEENAADKAEAEEVTSQPLTQDVEDQKPAEGLPAEPVAEEPAAKSTDDVVAQEPATDQVKQASETVVVEAADSGVCERPEEQDPTKESEPAAEENPSAQAVEVEADQTIEQPAEITQDATPSRTAIGTETGPESPLPVLAEEAQVTEVTEALEHKTPENLSKPDETTVAAKPVDTPPSLEEIPEPNEESSRGQEPIPILEEEAVESSQPEDATTEPEESPEEAQPSVPESPEASVQEPVIEAEVLPGDSISQRSRCETISDSNSGRRSPLIEEPALDHAAPEAGAAPSSSMHSSKVSFDEPPISTKGKEPASPPKERRKSSKSSSSNRYSSSRHKVKDVSRPPSDQKSSSAPTSSRRRSSTTTAPQPGIFRRISTTNSRSSRVEAAEQAEIKRRAAELAAREQEVQRQLERARKRAALEEQERLLRVQEEELARLKAAEKEKKRARREEQKRREQEALEQERLARERAEEEARAKELERAERRKRRRESERARHEDDRPRAHRHSSNQEPKARDISPTAKPKARRQKTQDIRAEHQRSRGEHDTREVPTSSRSPEERRHRRSSHRDTEKAEKPKKSIWKSLWFKM